MADGVGNVNILRNINNNLFTSIKKFQLISLIDEVEHHLIFLKNKCNIHEYFLKNALKEKPFRIFASKYKKWTMKIKKLEENYENACNNYLEECRNYDELVKMFEDYNDSNE